MISDISNEDEPAAFNCSFNEFEFRTAVLEIKVLLKILYMIYKQESAFIFLKYLL